MNLSRYVYDATADNFRRLVRENSDWIIGRHGRAVHELMPRLVHV